MSEYNMAVAAGRRVDQQDAQTSGAPMPAYEVSFLEALEPALDDMARHRVRLAVNAGVADTSALYDVVTAVIQKRGLDLKVCRTNRTANDSGTSL